MTTSALTHPVALSHQPAVARRELSRLLDAAAWDGDVDGVILAVHEAMVNAQRHGGGVTDATAALDGDDLVVRVADRGEGFELPDTPGIADSAAEQGRGLFLIRHLCDDAEVVRRGPDVCLVLTFEG